MNKCYLYWFPLIFSFFSSGIKSENAVITKKGSHYILSYGDCSIGIDTANGGRIISFKLLNNEVLYRESGINMNGSTFWPSPQSLWGWPPPANIDSKPYKVLRSDNLLLLAGQKDPGMKIRIYKSFQFNKEDTSFTIRYYIKNEGGTSVNLAPWEITRIPMVGLVCFQAHGDSIEGVLSPNIIDTYDYKWYNLKNAIVAGGKLFANGKGWIAYVNDEQRIIFLKRFEDISFQQFAPSESDIEIYTANDRSYTEIENQGKYTQILPGDSVSYRVDWKLRILPDSIVTEAGNTALIHYLQYLLAKPLPPDSISSTTVKQKLFKVEKRNIVFDHNKLKFYGYPIEDYPLQVKIFDINGRLIKRTKINLTDHEVSFIGQQQGMYFIQTTTRIKEIFLHKIVIF